MDMKYKRTLLIVPTILVGFTAISALIGNTQPVPATQAVQQIPKPLVTIPTPTELLAETNEIRQKNGVAPLVLDERLNASANLKLQSLIKEGGISHIDANGKSGYLFASEFMHECKYTSENLQGTEQHSRDLKPVYGFAASEPHWKAVNDPRYEYVGFAVNKDRLVMHFCDIN